MFIDELRRAAETAPRAHLDQVAKALWAALSLARIGEEDAAAISTLIEARRAPALKSGAAPAARRFVGSRPRTDASMERRRRWAASGRLPPQLAARFTIAEQAVLSLVAAETCRRGDCRLAVGHLAAVAGVSETVVRNALREARRLGLVTVTERKVTGWRNDTNVVAIVSAEWMVWLRLGPKGGAGASPAAPRGGSLFGADRQLARVSSGGGCRFPQGTPTQGSSPRIVGPRTRH